MKFWKRKIPIKPSELAEALANDFDAPATFDLAKDLGLDATAKARFDEKTHRYRVASLLIALLTVEQKDPRFLAVRTELERRIFPPTPNAPFFAEIKTTMKDLSALYEQRKWCTWMRAWLSEIGIVEENPATLTLLACHFMDYQILTSDLLRSFKPAA